MQSGHAAGGGCAVRGTNTRVPPSLSPPSLPPSLPPSQTWFTHLPPILVLELSRFQYNQKSSQAEKLHNPLVFDRQLFLDRYLDRNKVEVRQRRREVAHLRGKMSNLQKRLLRWASRLHLHLYDLSLCPAAIPTTTRKPYPSLRFWP